MEKRSLYEKFQLPTQHWVQDTCIIYTLQNFISGWENWKNKLCAKSKLEIVRSMNMNNPNHLSIQWVSLETKIVLLNNYTWFTPMFQIWTLYNQSPYLVKNKIRALLEIAILQNQWNLKQKKGKFRFSTKLPRMLEKTESPKFSSLIQQGTYRSIVGYLHSPLKEILNKKKRTLLAIVTHIRQQLYSTRRSKELYFL